MWLYSKKHRTICTDNSTVTNNTQYVNAHDERNCCAIVSRETENLTNCSCMYEL